MTESNIQITRIREDPSVDGKAGELPKEIQEFNDLLLDLSARFIDVSPRDIRKEINRGLRVVGEYWKFDRVVLTELSNDGTEAHVTHSYTAPGVIQHYPVIYLNKIPALIREIQAGEPVSINPVAGDAAAREEAERDFIAKEPIRPGLVLPALVNGATQGVLFVDSARLKTWSGKLIKQLYHLNRIMTGALERWKAAEQIREIEQFEHLLSEVSATYINLHARELEKVLKEDFARLNKALGVDLSILYVTSGDSDTFSDAKPLIWFCDETQESNRPMRQWLQQNPSINSDHFPYLFRKWNRGEATPWQLNQENPGEAKDERQTSVNRNIISSLGVPIRFAGSVKGVINVSTTRAHKDMPKELIPRLRLFGEVFFNALMRKESEEKLQDALTEIKNLKKRVEADYFYLREEVDLDLKRDFSGVVGKSDALKKILIKVKQVAPTHASVLLLGETGTGKGLIARAIHNASELRNRPFMQVNCAALVPGLVESELFGHEKGAFTGASTRRQGSFEAARGTTLFLDEIGELPLEQQPKLLRVLEEGEFNRVGSSKTIHTDARVIAATSRDLEKEVVEGKFRQDLWYRLNIFPIFIPPLRSRMEDIPLFVAYFVEKYGKWAGKKFETIPVESIRALQNYHWPGNIRELRNTIERAVITSSAGNLHIEAPATGIDFTQDIEPLQHAAGKAKREQVMRALVKSNWVIEGPKGAARLLGMSGSNLRYYLRKYNIKRPAKF